MATPTPEERELTLVEKIDFRITNVANNEKKLQDLLVTFLAPLMLKLKSEHVSVRNKVTVICQRLTLFIKPPGVVLPVAALVEQFKANPDSALLRYYDLIFIRHSLDRLPLAERRKLAPKVLKGIGSDTGLGGGDAMFNVFLRLLSDIKLPDRATQEDEAFREEIGLSDAKDADFVAQWLRKLILLAGNLEQSVSRGLDENDYKFLTLGKPDTWSKDKQGLSLGETRRKAVKFLESGAFTDSERFFPALYASANADSDVAQIGNDMLKRTSISLEDEGVVKQLFAAHQQLGPAHRVRILRFLTKSSLAATFDKAVLDLYELHAQTWVESRSAGDAGYPAWVMDNSEAMFQFLNWYARATPRTTETIATARELISKLRQFIETVQEWPKPQASRNSADDRKLRCLAYDGIGALVPVSVKSEASGGDETFTSDLAIWLLESLASDPTADAVVHIDSALSSIKSFFRPAELRDDAMEDSNVHESFMQQLLAFMTRSEENDVRSTRHAVVQLANRCYPFQNTDARYIDILAISRRNERSDVVEEGRKGLDLMTFYSDKDGTHLEADLLPHWSLMVDRLGEEYKSFESKDTVMLRPNLVDFIKTMMFLSALRDFRITPDWQQQLNVLLRTDTAARERIREYLADSQRDRAKITTILQNALAGMLNDDVIVAEQCGRSLLEILPLVQIKLLSNTFWRVNSFLRLVRGNRKQLQLMGAKVLGLLLAAEGLNEQDDQRQDLVLSLADVAKDLKEATGDRLTSAEGEFLTTAYRVSREIYLGLEREQHAQLREQVIQNVPSILNIRVQSLDIVMEGLIHLWTAGIPAFGIPVEVTDVVEQRAYMTKHFIEPLGAQAKKGNEKAAMALGRIAMVADDEEIVEAILAKLYELYEIKQVEMHFAVGEAIAAAAACWDSEAVELTLDVESTVTSYRKPHRPTKLQQVLKKLLTDSLQTKPSLIKASGIWLFCIIQYCSGIAEVQDRLRDCQTAFIRLLSARDELVQETASRGLSLVYQKGDPELKEALTREFINSFTGSGPQIKVDDETELFEAGALPTGDGKSITSYKDIVSLANEVGDQSLIYKFMSLANNAATWAARSAFGRFGLSNILAETDVDPKLYPKLYRYRFDPNPNVQKSMDDIWKALVKNPTELLDERFDIILQDLLSEKSITGREWRVREASCGAIVELLQGRPFGKYEWAYEKIWIAALKVLDDVKTSVRGAALNLCVAMSNTLVRQLEESSSSNATKAMLTRAVPFLLSDKGIESTTQDVKGFATITVIKLAKRGGSALKPYIVEMVTCLLGLLSTIEPEQINYYYQRAGEDNRDKIDKLRSQMVSQSPLSEAVDNLLRQVDASEMAGLDVKLQEVIKSAIGMPTKIGSSRVLVTLATRHVEDFKPYSARFLRLLTTQSLDRNDEVSSSYARAAAHVFRVASEEAQKSFLEQVTDLYFKSENDTRRQKVADIVLALSKISPDHVSAWDGTILPFAFVGKHDTDEFVQKAFGEVWSSHAGSSLTVVRWAPEIVAMVERALDTTQWALRHGAALVSASLVTAVSGAHTLNGSVANASNMTGVWRVLEKSLALKTFPGKEKLLDALVAFVKHAQTWPKDATGYPALADKPRTIAVREAKRNNETYRPHAFGCLWKIAAALESTPMLDQIAAIVGPFIIEFVEEVEMKDRDDKAGQAAAARGEDLRSKTAWAGIEAIARGYNRGNMKGDAAKELKRVVATFDSLGSNILNHPQLEPIRRTYWYKCVNEVLTEAFANPPFSSGEGSTEEEVSSTLMWFLNTLDLGNAQSGTEQQRLARAKAASTLLGLWKGKWVPEEERKGMMANVEVALREERSLEVKRCWTGCEAVVNGW